MIQKLKGEYEVNLKKGVCGKSNRGSDQLSICCRLEEHGDEEEELDPDAKRGITYQVLLTDSHLHAEIFHLQLGCSYLYRLKTLLSIQHNAFRLGGNSQHLLANISCK